MKYNYAFFKVAVLFLASYQIFHALLPGFLLTGMFLLCYSYDIKKGQ